MITVDQARQLELDASKRRDGRREFEHRIDEAIQICAEAGELSALPLRWIEVDARGIHEEIVASCARLYGVNGWEVNVDAPHECFHLRARKWGR